MELIIFTFENEFFIIGYKWHGFLIGRYFYIASNFGPFRGMLKNVYPE